MFYSKLLLSKKGVFNAKLFAAYCHQNLRKDQIQQTDISASVGGEGVVTVPTPAPREPRNVLNPRQILLDDTINISHIEYKNWMEDCTDLTRKRRRVSRSKADGLSNITDAILEPRIPVDFSAEHEKTVFDVGSPETQGVDRRPGFTKSIATPSHEQTLIPPGTPVAPSRSHEFELVAEPYKPTTAVASVELARRDGMRHVVKSLEVDPEG